MSTRYFSYVQTEDPHGLVCAPKLPWKGLSSRVNRGELCRSSVVFPPTIWKSACDIGLGLHYLLFRSLDDSRIQPDPERMQVHAHPQATMVADLITAIQAYLDNYNQNPQIFVWSAPVGRILAKVVNVKKP